MRMCEIAREFDRTLHEREMTKRKANPRSFQRWKTAHPERLDRYHELRNALHPPKKGYGLRSALVQSGILVITTYVSCSVYTCRGGKETLTIRLVFRYRAGVTYHEQLLCCA